MSLSWLVSPSDKIQIGETELAIIAEVFGEYFQLPAGSVELSLADPTAIKELNCQYRSIAEPTDVLSFPTFLNLDELRTAVEQGPALLGSIIICPEKASLYQESLPQLVHHGLLHLLGFDHERNLLEWEVSEGAILALLKSRGLTLAPLSDDTF